MRTYLACVVAGVLLLLATSRASGVVTVSVQFVPGTTNTTTTAISGTSTTGEQMAGMTVVVEFIDGTLSSATWGATGFQAGAATGSGWTLRTVGDTFFSQWTFENNTGIPIRSFRLDGGPGDTLFDTTFGGVFGTPGSGRGRTFRIDSAPDGLSIVATYRDLVGILGETPVGDVFRRLEVAFSNIDGFASGASLIFQADTDNIEFGGDIVDDLCARPWDNGVFDRRTAQSSQVGTLPSGQTFRRVSADDFWLCEGSVHRIGTIRARLLTNALVPKAELVVYEDCNGVPGRIVARATPLRLTGSGDPLVALGAIMVTETSDTYEGFRVVEVTASFAALHLKGGTYWLSTWGFSGTSDPADQFFWGTSGDTVIKGLPGLFQDSASPDPWISTADLGCGCTDFNFQIEGESCKIILDNGIADTSGGGVVGEHSLEPATPSSVRTRAADQFVVPPCDDQVLCYIEAYVWTNCSRVGLEVFAANCHCPTDAAPIMRVDADKVIPLGPTIFGGLGAGPLRLVKAVFTQFPGRGLRLSGGTNYWISAFGLGDASFNARTLFAYATRCDRTCPVRFDPLCRFSSISTSPRWTPGVRDLAFLAATADPVAKARTGIPGDSTSSCRADFNRDRIVTLQDVFDFLQAWFSGC